MSTLLEMQSLPQVIKLKNFWEKLSKYMIEDQLSRVMYYNKLVDKQQNIVYSSGQDRLPVQKRYVKHCIFKAAELFMQKSSKLDVTQCSLYSRWTHPLNLFTHFRKIHRNKLRVSFCFLCKCHIFYSASTSALFIIRLYQCF